MMAIYYVPLPINISKQVTKRMAAVDRLEGAINPHTISAGSITGRNPF
jgi:hypothetical protein